jgi:hypothetical protein
MPRIVLSYQCNLQPTVQLPNMCAQIVTFVAVWANAGQEQHGQWQCSAPAAAAAPASLAVNCGAALLLYSCFSSRHDFHC